MLPAPTHKEFPISEYPQYAFRPGGEMEEMLERLQVRILSAIHYRATPAWYVDRYTADDRLFFLLKGKGTFYQDGREWAMQPGDWVHVKRGVYHRALTDPEHPLEFVSLRFTALLYESLHFSDLFPLPAVIHAADPFPFLSMLLEMCRLHALNWPGGQQSLDAAGLWLLLWIVRQHGPCGEQNMHSARLKDLQRLVPALRDIQKNLQTPASVPHLARLCNLSPEQFRRVFRRVLLESPARYQTRVRMQWACRALLETNATLETIAAQSGYNQMTSFIHAFIRTQGVSPTRYRQSNGECAAKVP